MKKWITLLLLLIPFGVKAEDITATTNYYINENVASNKIKDNNENTYITINQGSTLSIENEQEINAIYIVYELKSVSGKISNDNKENDIGNNGYLHEYIDVKKLIGTANKITINYNENVKIADIYVLSEGEIPEYIEIWNQPHKEADLVLFSTHSDDEHLFFLGLLPTYIARGANVQVVYFTNHNDTPSRLHEQLHGLYTVGVRNYPIIGFIPDAYSESLEGAINSLKKANLEVEDALKFEVEMIRRFKPLVIVGHDEKGEYSHGQHILNTYILEQAIEKANDSTYDLDSLEKYNTWNVPKTYLHLYPENPIVMDYDIPLEYFNGQTAYEVSKAGYSKHKSQQWTWFTKWINGKNNEYTKATDIKTYSPVQYGLYRSLVGEDINKNDMFENLTLRKDEIKEEPTIKEEKTSSAQEKERFAINKNVIFTTILATITIVGVILIIRLIKKNKH